ncbi:DNA internalization-related competence protein ComEC/Rec2 [Saccharospirillum sp. MSK14-1]|uniref:DNA internalization-related competence protein ComEC/Rec2 n=1 Tax=Saccharospirillum sp. MSK14-1 TaxID=1897632 RepID=UPI000D3D2856|nr:DNA internalization-related competence protein ComEC/Rec2 [Saccharospirillum sp. MSK14-1]PTY36646.1 DNA internalization-related competence protein ComEC/Rec2 [Saccharospirillum sp. MSK14-1]
MINGLIGLAVLCLTLPYLWFQWGLAIAALPMLLLPLVANRRWWLAALWLLMAASLLLRLETEASHVLPRHWQHDTAELQFCLSQPAQVFDRYQRFTARVIAQPEALSLRRIRLSAPSSVVIEAGDCVNAEVRLRQPVGQRIPGNFNATRYYFSERIDALGTVVEVLGHESRPNLVVRRYQRAESQLDDEWVRAVWAALALGWSTSMDTELADLFEQNQIKHLMVVSGMHIAMVAAWALLLARLIHRLPGPWRGRWPQLRLLMVVTVCGLFVALTGFGFPALRAWLMLLVPLLAMLLGVRLSGHQTLALAAIAITVVRPQAWLSTGSWLSFGLVWIMIRLYQRWRCEPIARWQLALRFQAVLSMLSLPMAALLGFQWHPLSLLINMLVIPVVTLLILPWSLLILLWPEMARLGYQPVVSAMINGLDWVAAWHQQAPAWPLPDILLLGSLLWLALSHWLNRDQRWLVLPLLALPLIWPGRLTSSNEFRLTALDVGHGSALVLQWPDQTWLYDAAGQWSDGTAIAEARLAAWFKRHRIQLNGMVISHSDIDHAGGAQWAADYWPGAERFSGEPQAVARLSERSGWLNCHQADSTQLPFQLIAIPIALRNNDNDRSCVAVVETSAGRVLITGDASRRLEYWLLQAHPELFPFSVLVLGHHGSRTSSAPAFLDASPEALLLVSAGDRSRPRWPNADLLSYITRNDRALFNTAWSGTLALQVQQGRWQIRDWRSAFRRRFIRN